MIVGWSLINSSIHDPHYRSVQSTIKDLKEKNVFEESARFAIGSKYLEPLYRGFDLMSIATDIQDDIIADKFNYYLATVLKSNISSLNFCRKNNFKEVFEKPHAVFFARPITKLNLSHFNFSHPEIKGKVVNIEIRLGEPGDEYALHEINHNWKEEIAKLPIHLNSIPIISVYAENDFRTMIDLHEIVVIDALYA
jgi:hypothetical protein